MPNEALYNSNNPTSSNTRGHSYERFQAPFLLRPLPTSTSAADLKGSADAVLATFTIPQHWGAVQVLYMGGHLSTTGGAVTTFGTAKLTISGVDVEDALGDPIVTPELLASAAAYSPIEKDMNRTTRETNLQNVPDFPILMADEVAQMRVATQGSGAGAQTIWPYLIVRIAPNNGDLYPQT